MSAEIKKVALNLRRFAIAIATHATENPSHTVHGIGLHPFDMERLGFDEGEEILPGIRIEADNGAPAAFRILCDGEHEENPAIEEYREMILGPRETEIVEQDDRELVEVGGPAETFA